MGIQGVPEWTINKDYKTTTKREDIQEFSRDISHSQESSSKLKCFAKNTKKVLKVMVKIIAPATTEKIRAGGEKAGQTHTSLTRVLDKTWNSERSVTPHI